MPRADRSLARAALASIALHVAVLLGVSPLELATDERADPPPLEARLVTLVPARVEAPKPVPARAPAARPGPPRAQSAPARSTPEPTRAAIVPDPPLPDGGYAAALAEAADRAAQANAPSGASADGVATAVANGSAIDGEESGYPVRRARLVYDLNFGGGPAGVVVHTWSSDGRTYEAESIAEGIGLVRLFFDGRFVQRSVGTIGREGLVPAEYTLERGSAARRERARFDWDAGRITFSWKGERREDGLPTGAQDALSILHQVYFVRPSGGAGPVDVATSRKLGHYVYELVGERLLETPIGILRTMHVRRLDQDGRTLDAWLDLDRSLLPMRIVAAGPLGNPLEQLIREVRVEE